MNKPYHHGNLRAALLQAARARLSETTEADLSLRELAGRVGVSVNATYRHFPSKEALLMDLAAQGFDALTARMRQEIARCAAGSAEQRLHAAGVAYIEFARHDPALFRLMFGRKVQFAENPHFAAAAQGAFDVVVDCVAAVRGADAGSSQVVKAAAVAWSLVHGYATLDIAGHLAAMPEACRPEPLEAARMIAVA